MVDKSQFDIPKALAHRAKPYEVTVTNNDAILYSLGIGFSQDPMNEGHFRYTYENAEDFAPFPTQVVVVGHRGAFAEGDFRVPGIPEFNPMMLLHGEEEITMKCPLKTDTKYVVQENLADFQDKGKGALMIIDTTISEVETKQVQSVIRTSLFIRGLGGFGHKGTIKSGIPKPPKRAPDMVKEETTTPNQAILYRLTNDRNPLHIDPQMAQMGNFEKPILHGMCFMGVVARSVQQAYFKDDPNKLQNMASRMTGHVFPGETLIVSTWKEGSQIIFAVKTKERDTMVLVGAIKMSDEKAKM